MVSHLENHSKVYYLTSPKPRWYNLWSRFMINLIYINYTTIHFSYKFLGTSSTINKSKFNFQRSKLYHLQLNLLVNPLLVTLQKRKLSIKDFFSKWDQLRRKLRIWLHLLKKFLMENLIFCAVGDCTFPTQSNHIPTLHKI